MLTAENVATFVAMSPGLRIGFDVDIAPALEAARRGLVVVGAATDLTSRDKVHHMYPPVATSTPAQLVEALHPDAVDVLKLIAQRRHATEAQIAKARFNGRVLPARGVIQWLLWAGQIVPDPHGRGYSVAPVAP